MPSKFSSYIISVLFVLQGNSNLIEHKFFQIGTDAQNHLSTTVLNIGNTLCILRLLRCLTLNYKLKYQVVYWYLIYWEYAINVFLRMSSKLLKWRKVFLKRDNIQKVNRNIRQSWYHDWRHFSASQINARGIILYWHVVYTSILYF